MKFVLSSVSKCSGRIGLLSCVERLPDRTFRTPMLLISNPHLSREVLEISGLDKADDIGISLPLTHIEQMEKPVALLQKPISDFVGLKEFLTFVTLKNSNVTSPTGLHEKGGIPIFKNSGKITINADRYMDIMETFRPDAFTSLADGDTFEGSSKKRITRSTERSEAMFIESVKRQEASKKLQKSFFIATIEGAYNEFERKRLVKQVRDHDDVIDGYFIDGLHRNGAEATTVNLSSLNKIVTLTVSLLPEEKLKIMLGAYLPHVSLELLAMGIDVVDTSFTNIVTDSNRALVFNFNVTDPKKVFPEIDLTDSKFKDDFSPLLEGCLCLACRKHSRAYINHLLNTRELLGPMLLSIHNLHHYKSFFESVRDAVEKDQLQLLIKLISDQYKEAQKVLVYKSEEKSVEKPEEQENKRF